MELNTANKSVTIAPEPPKIDPEPGSNESHYRLQKQGKRKLREGNIYLQVYDTVIDANDPLNALLVG